MAIGGSQQAPAKTAPISVVRTGRVGRARDAAARLLTDYRRQSKYFRWKSWIVAGYAVVALASLAVFLWPANTIHAFAHITRSEMDGRPLVFVRNDSTRAWTRVRVIVNDAWELDQDRLPPGENIDVSIATFHSLGSAATLAPGDLVPQSIRVRCDQGSYEESFE